MNRLPILFRCDGSPSTGWEALYQGLTLAAAMQRRRRGTYIMSRLEPPSLALSIRRGNNEWIPADEPVGSSEDQRQTLREAHRLQAAAIVVASAQLNSDYLDALAATGMLVVAVDSVAQCEFPRGLVVNPLLAPSLEAYPVRKGTHFLLGPRYALVRSLFRRMRPLRSQDPPAPLRVLVALGDDDPDDQVWTRTQELLAMPKVEKIDVAVRTHHARYDELLSLAETHSTRLEIVTEPSDIGSRVAKCHLALTSGDGWSLELACVGVPQLILAAQDRHFGSAQRLDEEGAASLLGRATEVSTANLRQAVLNLLADASERRSMARSARLLIDGRGPDRVVNAMEILLHPYLPIQAEAQVAA